MYDKEIAVEALRQLRGTTATILDRFETVTSVEDFSGSKEGMRNFDSICMLLIAVGEGLKNLDKITAGALLPQYPQVDWKKAKGLRDVLSHRYFDVDFEQIYNICATHVVSMDKAFGQMLDELS